MTRYEVTLRHPDKGKFLHSYTPRKSRSGLINTLRRHSEEIKRFTASDDWRVRGKASEGIMSGNGWILSFSGRTQATALIEGELPWYRDRHQKGGSYDEP